MDRPPDFSERHQTDWSRYVLAHGLVSLPSSIAAGESVPVARWQGDRSAHVLHVENGLPDDEDDDDYEDGDDDFDEDWVAQPQLMSSAEHFLLDDSSEWKALGSGGVAWFDPPLVRPSLQALGDRYVVPMDLSWHETDGVGCGALHGVSAEPVAALRVVSATVEYVELESSIGAWIVDVLSYDAPVVLEALDRAGRVLESKDAAPTSRGRFSTRNYRLPSA